MGGKERESCVTKLLLNTFSFLLGKGGDAGFK